jgi:hypothetical protein
LSRKRQSPTEFESEVFPRDVYSYVKSHTPDDLEPGSSMTTIPRMELSPFLVPENNYLTSTQARSIGYVAQSGTTEPERYSRLEYVLDPMLDRHHGSPHDAFNNYSAGLRTPASLMTPQCSEISETPISTHVYAPVIETTTQAQQRVISNSENFHSFTGHNQYFPTPEDDDDSSIIQYNSTLPMFGYNQTFSIPENNGTCPVYEYNEALPVSEYNEAFRLGYNGEFLTPSSTMFTPTPGYSSRDPAVQSELSWGPYTPTYDISESPSNFWYPHATGSEPLSFLSGLPQWPGTIPDHAASSSYNEYATHIVPASSSQLSLHREDMGSVNHDSTC